MLDVAIIGGGPVGLATAAALLQAREPVLNVKVFERADDMKPCGAGLFIQPNGFRALHAIHPKLYADIKDVTIVVDNYIGYKPDGSITKTNSSMLARALQDKYGFPGFRAAGWSDVRAVLCDFLPAGTVQLGKKFASLQQLDDHVEICFTDGSSIKAEALIGADGNFSKVRQQSLNDGLPTYAGNTAYRARLAQQDGLPSTAVHQFNLGGVASLYYPIKNGDCVWSLSALDAHRHNVESQSNSQAAPGKENQPQALESDPQGSLLLRAKKLWGDRHSLVSTAMNATDPATVVEHKLHIRQPSSLDRGHWGVGRVTLAGDAAHPMRPTNGQGLNQGLEDAAALGRQVKAAGLGAESLRSYEKTRIPRVQQVMATELVSGMRAFSNRPQHLPEDLAKYRFATEVWEKGISPELQYFDWLLRDTLCETAEAPH